MKHRDVPSPRGLPVLGNTLSFARDPFRFVDDAVSEHGDVFRMDVVGKERLYVLAHPDDIRRALVTDVESFEKTADFTRAFGSGLLSAEGSRWRRQRDVIQPFFYPKRVREYEPQMREQIRRRTARWRSGETRDLLPEMKNLALEVVFATLFGRELDPERDGDLYAATNDLNEWFRPTSWALPLWLPTLARRRFHRATSDLHDEVERLIAARESHDEGDEGGDDLLSDLLRMRASADDRRLSDEEITDQLITFSFAGHETTALAMTFAWYLLSEHPRIRERFHAELDRVLAGRPPTAADLDDLEYTDRILTEVLRLYPPVHTIPRRTASEVTVDGHRIPPDSEIHLSIIQAHRHEGFYDDPEAFRPDRWKDGFRSSLHEFAYVPFGGGRRSCIGREFALFEAKLILATIGQRFRLDYASTRDLRLALQMTTQPRKGVPMRITERETGVDDRNQ